MTPSDADLFDNARPSGWTSPDRRPTDRSRTAGLLAARVTGDARIAGDLVQITGVAACTTVDLDGAQRSSQMADVQLELAGDCGQAAAHVVAEAIAAGLVVTVEIDALTDPSGGSFAAYGSLQVRGRELYVGPATLTL